MYVYWKCPADNGGKKWHFRDEKFSGGSLREAPLVPSLESRMRSNFFLVRTPSKSYALFLLNALTRAGPGQYPFWSFKKGLLLSSIVQSLLPHHVNRASSVTIHNFFGDFPDKLFQNYFVCDALPVLIATTSIN